MYLKCVFVVFFVEKVRNKACDCIWNVTLINLLQKSFFNQFHVVNSSNQIEA